MHLLRFAGLVLVLAVLAACAKKEQVSVPGAPGVVSGEQAKAGSMLAYSHQVHFEVAPESMAERVAAVRTACNDEQYGACSVLGIEQGSGSYPRASIKLRVVPTGVEPLIALAGDDGKLTERKTEAEDLAEAVSDVAGRMDLLQRERDSLIGYRQRDDLAVADMLTLSRRLAEIESDLHELNQTAANQQRRLETNLLRLEFRSNVAYDDGVDYSLGELWGTFVESLAEGVYDLAEYAGYLLPLVLLVFPIALLWRWAWRRVTGAHKRTA